MNKNTNIGKEKTIKKFIKELSILRDSFFKQITHLGSITIVSVLLMVFIIFYFEASKKILISMIVVNLIAYIIKIFFFKPRPEKQPTNTFLERIDASSFPSVHVIRMTTLVFWIFIFFNNIYFEILSLILGILVAYSRIYLKKHYLIDIIGGIIIALIVNLIIYLIY